MAGHSHSKNVEYRKKRQGAKRGTDFAKLAKKLEILVKEGCDLEKVLSIAREANFSKEKVQKIWQRVKEDKSK